jgi:hypothetical protein
MVTSDAEFTSDAKMGRVRAIRQHAGDRWGGSATSRASPFKDRLYGVQDLSR